MYRSTRYFFESQAGAGLVSRQEAFVEVASTRESFASPSPIHLSSPRSPMSPVLATTWSSYAPPSTIPIFVHSITFSPSLARNLLLSNPIPLSFLRCRILPCTYYTRRCAFRFSRCARRKRRKQTHKQNRPRFFRYYSNAERRDDQSVDCWWFDRFPIRIGKSWRC